MNVALNAAITIVPSGGALGAEVRGVDLSCPLDGALVSRLRKAWLDHLVLVFRGQTLTDAQLLAVARSFGEPHVVEICEYNRAGLLPEIDVISNVIVDGQPIGALGSGEAAWHTDMSMFEYPASATFLYGVELPANGGNTRFANMYAAYESLAPGLKEKVAGRQSIHDIAYTAAGSVRGGFEPVTDKTKGPGAVHPVVRTHAETGRKALFLGRRGYGYVHGLTIEESDAVLEQIWEHMTNQQFVWEHAWRTGDVIVWDNRCLIHSRGAFDAKARRVLRRVTDKGERPI